MAPERGSAFVRVLVLVLLAAAPLLAGAVHEPVFIPLLVGSAVAGVVTLIRHRHSPGPPLPGSWLLLGLHALVLLQLVPLPPPLLAALSPGSFAFYDNLLLVPPLVAWKPISVSPPDTLRGLAFLAAFSLLAVAVFRELGEGRWRRRLLRTRRLHRPGAHRGGAAAGRLVRAAPDLRRVAAALGLGGVRPVRQPQPLRGLPGDGGGPRRRLRTRSARAAAHGLVHPQARLPAARRGRGPGARARGRCRDGARGRPRRVALARRRLGLRLRDAGRPAADRLRQRADAERRGSKVDGARPAVARGPGRPVDRPRRRAAGVRGARRPRQPARPVARHAADGSRASPSSAWAGTLSRPPTRGTRPSGRPTGSARRTTTTCRRSSTAASLGLALVCALLGPCFRRALARASRSPVDLGLFAALLGLALHELVDFNGQIPANAATWVALAARRSYPPPASGVRGGLDGGCRRP